MKKHLFAAALLSTLAFGPAPAHAQALGPLPPGWYWTQQCVRDGFGGARTMWAATLTPVSNPCVYYGNDPRGDIWFGFGGGSYRGGHGWHHH